MSAHGFGFQRFDLPDGAEIKLQPLQQRTLEPPRSTATKTPACVSTSRTKSLSTSDGAIMRN
jgi:hypothetical protein